MSKPTTCAASLTAAARVRALRRDLGWPQRLLADKAGVSQCMVTMLETGKRNFTLPVLERVAEALGTNPAALLRPVTGDG